MISRSRNFCSRVEIVTSGSCHESVLPDYLELSLIEYSLTVKESRKSPLFVKNVCQQSLSWVTMENIEGEWNLCIEL